MFPDLKRFSSPVHFLQALAHLHLVEYVGEQTTLLIKVGDVWRSNALWPLGL